MNDIHRQIAFRSYYYVNKCIDCIKMVEFSFEIRNSDPINFEIHRDVLKVNLIIVDLNLGEKDYLL